MINDFFVAIGGLILIGIGVAIAAAWVTHIVICIAANTASAVALLIIGVVIPPVGVVHGLSYWLGYGWVAGI